MTQKEKNQKRTEYYLELDERLRGFDSFLNDISINTKYNYVRIAYWFIYYKDNLRDIGFDDYVKFLNDSKTREDGSPATQGNQIVVYSALKRFSEYLYVSRKAKEDYMKSIKRPKAFETQKTIEKRQRGYLTEDEIKRVLRQFDNRQTWQEYRDYAIIMLLLNTGMRRAALANINVSDYKRERKSLLVTDKGAKVREFILGNAMCNALDEWIEKRKSININELDALDAMFVNIGTYEDRSTGWINHVRDTRRISTDAIYGIVRRYTTCVEGKTISPHKLRATYGTQLYNKTHDIYFVQTCMGHNSPTTTERYVRGLENKTRDASEMMESLYL